MTDPALFAADAVTPELQHQATFRTRAAMGKQFEGIHRRVQEELRGLAQLRARGQINKSDFVDEFMSHLDSVASDVYRTGKRIASGKPNAWMTKQDRAEVTKYLNGQRAYVEKFATDLGISQSYNPKRGGDAIDRIDWRAGMYADRLEGLANRAFQRAAPGLLCQWRLGEAEHCVDCVAEAAKGVRLLARLRRVPGSGGTRCLTNCACFLEIITPGERKNIKSAPVTEPARL